jgi:hypothetical protein
MTPVTFQEYNYWSTLLGTAGSGVFALYLAQMIFRARRQSLADVALACILFLWGVVCFQGTYRVYTGNVLFPFLTPLLWTVVLMAEFMGVLLIRRELRLARQVDDYRTLVVRQEAATERQEASEQRMAVLLDEMKRDNPC